MNETIWNCLKTVFCFRFYIYNYFIFIPCVWRDIIWEMFNVTLKSLFPLCSYIFYVYRANRASKSCDNNQICVHVSFLRKIIKKAQQLFKLTKELLTVFLAYLMINSEIFLIKYLLLFYLTKTVILGQLKKKKISAKRFVFLSVLPKNYWNNESNKEIWNTVAFITEIHFWLQFKMKDKDVIIWLPFLSYIIQKWSSTLYFKSFWSVECTYDLNSILSKSSIKEKLHFPCFQTKIII